MACLIIAFFFTVCCKLYAFILLGMNRRIPNVLMQTNQRTGQIPASSIPEPNEAFLEYERQGGQITVFNGFGKDPLEQRPDLIQQREEHFKLQFPSFERIFHDTVNGNSARFHAGLLHFINISMTLCRQL